MTLQETLPALSNQELFSLVRLLASSPPVNALWFFIAVASEARRRNLTVTEDYVLHLAAKLIQC